MYNHVKLSKSCTGGEVKTFVIPRHVTRPLQGPGRAGSTADVTPEQFAVEILPNRPMDNEQYTRARIEGNIPFFWMKRLLEDGTP